MSNSTEVANLLLAEHKLSDEQIRKALDMPQQRVCESIHQINFSKRKFKDITILKSGKNKNLVREITTEETDENKILGSRDKRLTKGLRQLDVGRKEGLIATNTRQGSKNRTLLLNRILEQNLNSMVEAQKLLTN